MIQRLRRKFILSNMLLVFLVLVMVFAAACGVYHRVLLDETEQALRQALILREDDGLRKPMIGKPEGQTQPMDRVPAFSVLLADDGSVERVFGSENVSVSDETLRRAVQLAQENGGASGRLRELSLRFLRDETPDGVKFAFADTSHERSGMRSLLLVSLAVGTAAFAAFFLISLFLARQTLRPVEEAWAQQRRFVADASHELKTPLTVILANLGVLLSHSDESIAENRRWVEGSREEAVRMKGLMEDMLFLARSDADQAPMVTEEVNLSDLLWGSLLSFEPVAFEQGVTLHSAVEPDLLRQGAAAQLQQLFAILLDNAVKYAGEHGEIWVDLCRKEGKLVLSVRNTGEPIPPDSLPHIFDRFYRADAARTRERGGYGLGLAIAQRIAERHGGSIAAESGAGGTVFRVTL